MSMVLVFDLDDTLFLEKSFVLSGFDAVDKWLQEKKEITGFYNYCLDEYQSGCRGDTFNKVLDRLGVQYDTALIDRIVQIYREHDPSIELLDDAKEIIEYFLNKKQNLSIITDGYLDVQKNKVKALGVEKFFDFIIYSDINGRASWKPSLWPYLEVMKSYSDDSLSYTYIADNVTKDFVTAKKLGWQTIRIFREEGEYNNVKALSGEYEADYEVYSLEELKKIII